MCTVCKYFDTIARFEQGSGIKGGGSDLRQGRCNDVASSATTPASNGSLLEAKPKPKQAITRSTLEPPLLWLPTHLYFSGGRALVMVEKLTWPQMRHVEPYRTQ